MKVSILIIVFGIYSSGSRSGQVEGFCEGGNEFFSVVENWECSIQLNDGSHFHKSRIFGPQNREWNPCPCEYKTGQTTEPQYSVCSVPQKQLVSQGSNGVMRHTFLRHYLVMILRFREITCCSINKLWFLYSLIIFTNFSIPHKPWMFLTELES
jgi:hypothetical protein